MKLFIKDRIIIPVLLSASIQLTFEQYMAKKDLISKIKITEEEYEKFKIENVEGNIKWDIQEDLKNPIDIELDKKTASMIQKYIEEITNKTNTDDIWEVVSKLYDECAKINQ